MNNETTLKLQEANQSLADELRKARKEIDDLESENCALRDGIADLGYANTNAAKAIGALEDERDRLQAQLEDASRAAGEYRLLWSVVSNHRDCLLYAHECIGEALNLKPEEKVLPAIFSLQRENRELKRRLG